MFEKHPAAESKGGLTLPNGLNMPGLGWQWTWTLKPLKHGSKVEVRGYVNTKKALWAGLRLSGVMRSSPPGAHNLWTLTLRCISNVLACVRRTYPHSWGGERIPGKTDSLSFTANPQRYHFNRSRTVSCAVGIWPVWESEVKTRGKGEWRANICCMQVALKSTLLQCFIPLFIAADCE